MQQPPTTCCFEYRPIMITILVIGVLINLGGWFSSKQTSAAYGMFGYFMLIAVDVFGITSALLKRPLLLRVFVVLKGICMVFSIAFSIYIYTEYTVQNPPTVTKDSSATSPQTIYVPSYIIFNYMVLLFSCVLSIYVMFKTLSLAKYYEESKKAAYIFVLD
ncbi:hypothetical protein HDV06_001782 [Boothiomyces sp. JEL0866]|nr:hypothetical protein HDV06_001782 [Boothiomyces sp. JEL0866]